MVPTTDRLVRWAHAFCVLNNGPEIFKTNSGAHGSKGEGEGEGEEEDQAQKQGEADARDVGPLASVLPRLAAADVRSLSNKDGRKTQKCSVCGRKAVSGLAGRYLRSLCFQ
jgi:hypothetical protein